MKIAPPTPNEAARLKALYDYDVLDTDAEKIFDDLTQLAAQICDTPITLISLVDPNRQWFKSKVGLDAEETSRDIAFCAHAIHQKEIFEVQDTLKDQRFFDNPLVTSAPNIRFYAGTPLVSHDGHAIGTLCVIDDKPNKLTSDQRQALEVLGRSVISQMELRKKIKELKQANIHKTEFLSNMSHELRTPLNAIIGFSRLMLDDIDIEHHKLPAKFSEYISHIDYSGKRLLSVVNSVIDLNKIEAGMMQVQIELTCIREFIKDLEGMLAITATEKDVAFSINVSDNLPTHLAIDQAKTSQIITNLVHNAIKFTDSGKWVKVEFSLSNENFVISVADQGAGISSIDQTKLFGKFQQVGQAKSSEGSGLGLSIIQGLVELLGGTIKVLSTLGSGSIFKVMLPLQNDVKILQRVSLATPEKASFDHSSKVLLVEDNEINQAVMLATFESLDIPITIVGTGEEAIEIVKNQPFDLIFMDIHLPGIDGRQASEKIKLKYPQLPIIALSADAFNQHKFDDKDKIWDEYLCKPLEKEKLVQALNRFIPFSSNT
ncbi:hybrid sensor histidine kinase/response regulator [Paraglaciecola arctica]|uniref:histidine kinase n=1 Tax=Paraglaciecola arctica BSs20135 TaxID=493475 RepID=K6YTH3_9ALTE|nr:GAF domain-containing hybrid sensor histidine kinase/response regulator [Paraglaciecola arctica]GAC21457.1 histidine kinase response regulator hybrid protein [Paraglaciecola arctica BSs20135]